jgi:hypothetical protein
MKNNIAIRLAFTLTLVLGMASSALAGKALSADELKALIVGKTVSAHHNIKDKDFKVYFDADGTMVQILANGKKREGSYEISSSGEHCVDIGGTDNCAMIEDNGDGTYTRVLSNNDKRVIDWTAFTDGNKLD